MAIGLAIRFRARPPIGEWSKEQVGDFLETVGFDEAARKRFAEEGVDGPVLAQMSGEDLAEAPFKLPFGLRKTLLAEVQAQARYARARERQQAAGRGPVLAKGAAPQGPQISADALERIRRYHLDPKSGYRSLVQRSPPLTEEELECWQYQASWLACPITGKAWARGDVVSTMGVALYHAPRFCSEREKQRKLIEEEQARRGDADRKKAMDRSGTSFERDFEVYPNVEPPPLANLPTAAASAPGADAGELARQLKTEASGLKSRSAAVQRQLFEGLGGGGGGASGGAGDGGSFVGEEDMQQALDQLKVEPRDDVELAKKFGLYESYFAQVLELRGELFGLWEKGRSALQAADAGRMGGSLKRIDGFENLMIPERSRFWFVYHMMAKASENHSKMQQILDDLEELFEAACEGTAEGAVPLEDLSDDPQLGYIEVVIGPAFDIDAYNDGVNGNPTKGVLSAADRGVLDMDRQYNAVNFQFFVQRADAGATRDGAEASFERRLCTSRLSFYLDESHGSRVFPRNILSQLSLLFYRRNDALYLPGPGHKVNEHRVAVCVRKLIPRVLRAIVVHVFHGDRSFAPRVEKAVRLYLAVHQVAIKLLATFRRSYEALYCSVVEWVQQPFCPRSEAQWPDLEELLLGASLCSFPWALLREAFVRKLVAQLLRETTQMSAKAPIRQRAEHLFTQNRALLERLAYILAFFRAGPGKLPVREMDRKYMRCAGTVPRAERDALVAAAAEGTGVGSLVELWRSLGMESNDDVEEDVALRHIERFIEHVQANEAAWRAAAPPVEASQGPALPSDALEQLASIGAEASGAAAGPRPPQSRRERELAEAQRRAAERAQHQGYPRLPASRRLDGTLCYYCLRRFPSRMALFAHLRRVIDQERFIEGHHQLHFDLRVPGGPGAISSGSFRCQAEKCGREFMSAKDLWTHYHETGVPGFEAAPPAGDASAAAGAAGSEGRPAAAPGQALAEVDGPPPASEPGEGDRDLASCSVCMARPPCAVMVPCGHFYACEECGKKLKTCAICRQDVKQVLRIYYS
eukprot:CAMPEP_0175709198 /NCGR_PEP_ID=MMETSP0097-20121207/39449_1 /TAXON_ID=311494 /ORGANISM="Alexandrium monilatum, Strain CCMP3105" /LENGTH=1037 /DNA_ID=CAMNT_0017016591 /DNA_START=8 /DNA_END=3121 /DNA_ORIENTATION=+